MALIHHRLVIRLDPLGFIGIFGGFITLELIPVTLRGVDNVLQSLGWFGMVWDGSERLVQGWITFSSHLELSAEKKRQFKVSTGV